MSPVTIVVETPLELTPSLHFALVSHAVRKILAAPTPPPGPGSVTETAVLLRVGESRARTRTEWNTQILT